MIERCAHNTCDFEQRLEYCPKLAGDPDDIAGLVVLKLDELLYTSNPITSDRNQGGFDSEGLYVERHFSYLHGDFKSWVWPLTETKLALQATSHQRPKQDRYHAAISWIVHQAGVSSTAVRSLYTLDVYPEGNVQTYVDQLSLKNGYQGQAATPYDLQLLYTELEWVAEVHIHELADQRQR